ncbi:unnamed protein product, partial [Discosporangium mesarthrocarpum]
CDRLRKESARAAQKEQETERRARQALLENEALSRTVERLQKTFVAEGALPFKELRDKNTSTAGTAGRRTSSPSQPQLLAPARRGKPGLGVGGERVTTQSPGAGRKQGEE